MANHGTPWNKGMRNFDPASYQIKYRQDNRSKAIAYQADYRLKNKELIKQKRRKNYLKKQQAKIAATLKWQKENKSSVNAKNRAYEAAKDNRTPKWLSVSQKNDMKQFYKDAEFLTNYTKECFEVDHIVPLRGKLVSGLHVAWNLQLLTKSENSSKNNKFGGV